MVAPTAAQEEKAKDEKANKDEKKKTGKEEKKDEMTEEDKKLEEDLNMLVQRLSSLCADIISVLAMCSDEKSDCINFRMKGMLEPIGDWGHEYVRHLAMEMSEEWKQAGDGSEKSKARRNELLVLARDIVMHNMKHNAEVEACDLLIEIERLDLLMEYVEDVDHQRVCLYLLSCAPLTPDPDNIILIRTAKDIYLKYKRYLEAVRCAIMLNDPVEIKNIFSKTSDP
ncbi:unnamed protein product, partial [Strongylus vulgaris]